MTSTIQQSVYYVYYYLRATDSAVAKSGTPYYVGKGKGDRATRKHTNINLPSDPSNIIIIAQNLTHYQALQMEILHIAIHGRIDLGTGILRNRTKGGDGCHEPGPDARKLMGHSLGKVWWNNGRKNGFYSHCPGPEWKLGRIVTKKMRAALLKSQKQTVKHIKGTKWWTNGTQSVRAFEPPGQEWWEGNHNPAWNKGKKGHLRWWFKGSTYVQSADQPGPEWIPGSPLKGKPRSRVTGQSNHKGTCWWTNGVERKRAAECPGLGWTKGTGQVTSGSKGFKWWTNGIENKFSAMPPAPDWIAGRTIT